MLNISISTDLEQELEDLGAHSVQSKVELVDKLLRQAVKEDREDRYWARLAEERLAKPGRRYTMEEVIADLGLDD